MVTSSSNFDSSRSSRSRSRSRSASPGPASFPAARLSGSSDVPVQGPNTTVTSSSLPRSSVGSHQFGSVPFSSTAVAYSNSASDADVPNSGPNVAHIPSAADSNVAAAILDSSPSLYHVSSQQPLSSSPSNRAGLDNYDPDFVRTIGRHLVSPKPSSPASFSHSSTNDRSHKRASSITSSAASFSSSFKPRSVVDPSEDSAPPSDDLDSNLYSLTLQGGDITRQVYNWQREHVQPGVGRGRSRSVSDIPRPEPIDDTLNIHSINVPGGFRRNFILAKTATQTQTNYGGTGNGAQVGENSTNVNGYIVASHEGEAQQLDRPRPFLTRNFLEFLSVYGHFAGEELEDEDEGEEFSEYGETSTIRSYATTADEGLHRRLRRQLSRISSDSEYTADNSSLHSVDEESGLLHGQKLPGSGKPHGQIVQDTSATKAVLLLLKGFVGTGVLFLPKAYYNGGMLFASAILFFVAVLTYYCFVLLIDARMTVQASFGDMGGILYGPKVRMLILTSIVLSQIGFAAAYTVFTSENVQAFIMAVTDCRVLVPVRYIIFLQLIVFVPMSMIRNISKLSVSALIADFFILLGLAYIYFWDGKVLIEHGVSDIAAFNSKDWTLFIGTAIFTFEGIGLVIPIHESMHKPQQFYSAIGLVMIIITLVYITMGILSYAAYGSNVETVVILNMPQDNKLVNSVQFIYAVAILLSTPLQIFPAIRIMENAWFPKSGKFDMRAKWTKNFFRMCVVLVTLFVAWGGADDLDKFVALIGSFACIPLTYIYPPLLHYRACARSTFQKSLDVIICVFGLGSMIYTTLTTIESWATSSSENDFFRYCA
ncbi:transmembrane amino acid transporter protein-domain-containing protein [Lipomyces oligophaga]|uniref:transmembrane amino acid transporter protein-domain-containing protein n=1 Tax=Lipomyces oligophaga TaxID=45792 RepID=UPI0034CDFB16